MIASRYDRKSQNRKSQNRKSQTTCSDRRSHLSKITKFFLPCPDRHLTHHRVRASTARVIPTHHHDASANCQLEAFSTAVMKTKDQSGLKTTAFAMSWLFSTNHFAASQRRPPSQCTFLGYSSRNLRLWQLQLMDPNACHFAYKICRLKAS
jgi:hypothetical protein